MPASASASVWAATPADVTGAIAPARMNGVMIVAWLSVGVDLAPRRASCASHTSGDDALIRLVITVRSARSPPKPMRASSTLSSARRPGGHRAHERLVAVAEVRVHHVEVALVHRHVDRLAHRAAGVVQVAATGTRASRSSGSRRASRSAGPRRDRARTATRSSARTRWRRRRSARCAPGCGRAACSVAGADRLHDLSGTCRAGSAPASPSTSAPASAKRVERRRGSRAPSMPTSSRIVSALCSMHREALLATRPRTGASVRVRNGSRAATCGGAVALARRPSAAASRRRVRASSRSRRSITWSSRSNVVAVVGRRSASAGRRRARQRRPATARCGVRRGGVRERHRRDEQLLEARLGRGLDLGRPSAAAARSRARCARDSSACTAPAPAALPTERTPSSGQSGISPSTIACSGSMWAPNAPASRTSVDRRIAGVLEQQVDPGPQRGLGELDGAHVVLGDRQLAVGPSSYSTYANVRPSATTRGAALGGRADDRAVASITPARNSSAIALDDARSRTRR